MSIHTAGLAMQNLNLDKENGIGKFAELQRERPQKARSYFVATLRVTS